MFFSLLRQKYTLLGRFCPHTKPAFYSFDKKLVTQLYFYYLNYYEYEQILQCPPSSKE